MFFKFLTFRKSLNILKTKRRYDFTILQKKLNPSNLLNRKSRFIVGFMLPSFIFFNTINCIEDKVIEDAKKNIDNFINKM